MTGTALRERFERRSVEFAVLGATAAWGLTFVIVPWALEECGFVTLTALRMTVGTVAAVVLFRPNLRAATWRTWRYGLLGGGLLAAGYLLQTAGMRTATPGEGGFLTAFYVTLVPVIDAAVHRRSPSGRELVLLLVATVGIALISVQPGQGGDLVSAGAALVALSSVFWAAQIVAVGRAATGSDPAVLATIQIAVTAAVTSAALLFVDEPPVAWSWELATAIFFLGYIACALGFAIQAWAQRSIPPTRTAILFSPEPVFAALAGWWLIGEEFGPQKLIGSAVVIAAVALTLVPRRAEAASG